MNRSGYIVGLLFSMYVLIAKQCFASSLRKRI